MTSEAQIDVGTAVSRSASGDLAIRRLWPFDQPAIRRHFQRLDEDSRRRRFAGAVGDEFVRTYAAAILRVDSLVYGAFVDGKLRGVAEMRGLLDRWPIRAEAAFSVEAGWQDKGIGDGLFTRVLAAARNRGVKSITMVCLRENDRMKHLAAKHDAVLDYDMNEIEARLEPSWPSAYSLAEEFAGETRSLVQAALHWPARTDR
ncbi:MAG: GNAT family N-acetyltransferase [Pseudomonadota bacterium]